MNTRRKDNIKSDDSGSARPVANSPSDVQLPKLTGKPPVPLRIGQTVTVAVVPNPSDKIGEHRSY